MKKKKSIKKDQPKPTNGHLSFKESKRTIVLTWGKYSVTVLCLTAIAIAVIQNAFLKLGEIKTRSLGRLIVQC